MAASPAISALAFGLSPWLLASAIIHPAQSLVVVDRTPMLWYRWTGLEGYSVRIRGKLVKAFVKLLPLPC